MPILVLKVFGMLLAEPKLCTKFKVVHIAGEVEIFVLCT